MSMLSPFQFQQFLPKLFYPASPTNPRNTTNPANTTSMASLSLSEIFNELSTYPQQPTKPSVYSSFQPSQPPQPTQINSQLYNLILAITKFLQGQNQQSVNPDTSTKPEKKPKKDKKELGKSEKSAQRKENTQNQQNQSNIQAAQGSAQTGLLSKIDSKELDAVRGEDLTAVDKKGNPIYLIDKAADGKYHIYKDDPKETYYRSVVKVKDGSNKLRVKDFEQNRVAAAAAALDPNNCCCLENQGGGKTTSPLILDTNKDGVVSAEHGKGVDVNGDGKLDGAATGGDKMLAMGDINGDGEITGKEVFGDETIDPFTGKAMNAENGFVALNMVAKSAEEHTGVNCLDEEGNVDLNALKGAMEKSGKGSLGLISDDNNTQLEGLGDAAEINTTNYINQQETGDVQHNQLGSYKTTDGQTHKVDDVWFTV